MISTPLDEQLVRGAAELVRSEVGVVAHRLPGWARAQTTDAQLAMVEAEPAGVRVVFRTAATVVELETVPTKRNYLGAPRRPDGLYDLVVDGRLVQQASVEAGNELIIDLSTGTVERRPGPGGTARFSGLPNGGKVVEIWLPHNELTELVALRTDAPVEPVADRGRRVWLHHGSSISQGSNAASPTGAWVGRVALAAGVDLVNLGLGGSSLLDPFVARTMRDTPADLISLKLGINLVNSDVMRLRAFAPAIHGFLDTIRDGHPDAPLLLVSPILCPIHENTPGPGAPDFTQLANGRLQFVATGDPSDPTKLRLTTIRDELAQLVTRRSDPNLHYLDGRALYGEADTATHPLPDNLHPDPATHQLIADRFTEDVFHHGPFAG